jgi:hypothetical protein
MNKHIEITKNQLNKLKTTILKNYPITDKYKNKKYSLHKKRAGRKNEDGIITTTYSCYIPTLNKSITITQEEYNAFKSLKEINKILKQLDNLQKPLNELNITTNKKTKKTTPTTKTTKNMKKSFII